MTRIIHGAGVGVTHGAGDGLSEFPSDLADAGTAGSAAALSVQASDASALVTLASSIRGSDASALRMRVLVAVSAAAVADSMIKPAAFRKRPSGEKVARQGLSERGFEHSSPPSKERRRVQAHDAEGFLVTCLAEILWRCSRGMERRPLARRRAGPLSAFQHDVDAAVRDARVARSGFADPYLAERRTIEPVLR